MTSYAALLRGINLGNHHKVPMAALRAVLSDVGLSDVATYIQSGNAVFASEGSEVEELTTGIKARLAAEFGFEIPVTLRSAAQLGALRDANPFLGRGEEPAVQSVGFLSAEPDAARVSELLTDPLHDPTRTGGDEFELMGREVFLFHPRGYGQTNLTNSFFDRRLGTTMTVRNWRTVMQLFTMLAEVSS
jgi:uncharacterized protein (DUF1697 family)